MAGRPRNSLLIVDAFLQPHEIIVIVPDLITLGDKAFSGLSTSLSLFKWKNIEHINFIVRKPRVDLTHH